jgi:hypothetical protein
MRACAIGLVLTAVLAAGAASAQDPYDGRRLFSHPLFDKPAPQPTPEPRDPGNCIGEQWDDNGALVVARVTARERVNFVQDHRDGYNKVTACPAATAACQMASYLVTGDLVLVGATRDGFTCVSYQSPQAKKSTWTRAWLPSAALKRVAPMPAPQTSDWLGNWRKPGGTIEITDDGIGGRLRIDGFMLVPTARDFRNGAIDAEVSPANGTIAFLNDGWLPFETKSEDACRVRMLRVGAWLLVQDNHNCGGSGVSFTGLYRRRP